MKGWVLVALAILVAVAVPIALSAVASLSGCGPSTPSPRVTDCAARYSACVASSPDVATYRACRDKVDAVCLTEAGAP